MGETIQSLLEQIQHKELVLPEFQREFNWNRTQVRRLFESLFKGYPTGSLLVWVTDQPPKIKNDAYNLENLRRVKVLLDGQQRLTSLYLHAFNKVPPYYNPGEIESSYFELYFNVESGSFGYYKKLQMENDPLWIQVVDLFTNRPSIYRLVESAQTETPEEKEKLFERIENNLVRLEGILQQEYPVQTVPTDANIREAIKVFDLINSQGTPLSQADIALAYMTAEWPDIRRVFKEKTEQLEGENFSFDLTFLTRCIVGIIDGVGELERFGTTTEEELKRTWTKLSTVLDYLISFLRSKGFIIGTDDLNTTNVLVPLVVYLSRHGWFTQDEESRFLYWMYAALFERRYSGSTETYLDRDISALLANPSPESLIATLKEDEGEPRITAANLDSRSVSHPLYNMANIVIRANGAVDWANGLPLVGNIGKDFRLQRHHIFPKSVLAAAGWDTGENLLHRKRVHEIANRIPLTQDGNMEIFNREPAEYLPTVESRFPGILQRSLIPENKSLWKVENYAEFLAQRRQLIADAINRFMNGLVENERRHQNQLSLADLAGKDESARLEFKARFIGGSANYRLEDAVTKAVAGMLNAYGGVILLGVADDGSIVGLEQDFAELSKKNRDGFEIHLTNYIGGKLGMGVLPLLQARFEKVDGHYICAVEVDPSSRPVYLRENNTQYFYVRTQNSTRPFNMEEANAYIEDRFS